MLPDGLPDHLFISFKTGGNGDYSNIADHIEPAGKVPEFFRRKGLPENIPDTAHEQITVYRVRVNPLCGKENYPHVVIRETIPLNTLESRYFWKVVIDGPAGIRTFTLRYRKP